MSRKSKFDINQYNNFANKIKNLELESKNFDKMAKILLSQKELFIEFLKYIRINKCKLKCSKYIRKFTTIFLIKFHDETLFGTVDKREKNLKLLADKIYEELTTVLTSKDKYPVLLKIRINRFIKMFDEWKEKDANLLLKQLAIMYQNSLKTLKNKKEINIEFKEQLEKYIMFIEKQALRIDKDGLNFIKKYKIARLKKENIDDFNKIAKQAFWDGFIEDIELEKYDRLEKMLKEIRDRLCSFVPNRPDYHNDFDEHFDIKFIMQMLEDDALNSETMGKYMAYLLDKIKELEAPIDNGETDKIRQTVTEMLQTSETGEILAYFLENVYNKLDKIATRCREFYEFAEKVKSI